MALLSGSVRIVLRRSSKAKHMPAKDEKGRPITGRRWAMEN